MSVRIWHGRAVPCCINHEYSFGSTIEESLYDIYSTDNKKWTEFRQQFLTGSKLPPSCIRCIQKEQAGHKSHRIFSNEKYEHLLPKIPIETHELYIAFWCGAGFSNLCNLKCRMCSPLLSTSIAIEENHLPKTASFNNIDDFYRFFNDNLETLEEIAFEGGEPMMIEEHFKILEYLINKNKVNVRLKYHSNLTNIKLKNYDIIEMWSHFNEIELRVSIDACENRNHYIRYPSNWDNIISNLTLIKNSCPNVKIDLALTIQLLNAFDALNLHKFMNDNELVHSITYTILVNPKYYQLTVLPIEIKQRVEEHWSEFSSNEYVKLFLSHMWSSDDSKLLPDFFAHTFSKDKIRNNDFFTTFPEFADLKKYI